MKKLVTEMCPNCENEVEMQLDIELNGYKYYCPYCGNRLMLCDECMHGDGDKGGVCDYNSETDTCKHNKESKLRGIDRLLEKNGDLIQRICHYPENQVGNAPCYGCARRTRCNQDIFERLLAYENSGLSPEEVEEIRRNYELLRSV